MRIEKKKPLEKLSENIYKNINENRITLSRNLSYGSSAACLILLLQVIPIGVDNQALKISTLSAVIGMPLWFLIGTIYDMHISAGENSHGYFAKVQTQNILGLLFTIAGLALLVSISAAIWYLSKDLAIAFIILSSCCIVAGSIYMSMLAEYIYPKKD